MAAEEGAGLGQQFRAMLVLQVKGVTSGEAKRNVFALLFRLISFHSQIP